MDVRDYPKSVLTPCSTLQPKAQHCAAILRYHQRFRIVLNGHRNWNLPTTNICTVLWHAERQRGKTPLHLAEMTAIPCINWCSYIWGVFIEGFPKYSWMVFVKQRSWSRT